MSKSAEYYLSKGFDRPTALYLASGRKRIVAVKANPDDTLTLDFDNGERRLYDCRYLFHEGSVFMKLKRHDRFQHVYLDDTHAVSWDIDPAIDSNVVWSNKLDLCPDTCYIDSVPIHK